MISATVPETVELYVRGEIPADLSGSLLVSTSRRHKSRSHFSRWHDSQTDLMKVDLIPGRPGRARASILPVDSSGADLESFRPNSFETGAGRQDPAYGYVTQPNHGLNVCHVKKNKRGNKSQT